MTTLKQAKAICGDLEFSLTKRDGEYRLADRREPTIERREATACYTNDLADAVDTARHIRRAGKIAEIVAAYADCKVGYEASTRALQDLGFTPYDADQALVANR